MFYIQCPRMRWWINETNINVIPALLCKFHPDHYKNVLFLLDWYIMLGHIYSISSHYGICLSFLIYMFCHEVAQIHLYSVQRIRQLGILCHYLLCLLYMKEYLSTYLLTTYFLQCCSVPSVFGQFIHNFIQLSCLEQILNFPAFNIKINVHFSLDLQWSSLKYPSGCTYFRFNSWNFFMG